MFIVVCCGACERFQVVQRPKSNKFQCRICQEKNSVRRVYGCHERAKRMRIVCQRLNIKRGEMEQHLHEDSSESSASKSDEESEREHTKSIWDEFKV
mmetsp:Transcript_44033/g.70512  ORF Transcript_44033/g.70512 Transcript_44033/m.70512 type:complete len:97 (+) Transcript_44033:809-1099(+)